MNVIVLSHNVATALGELMRKATLKKSVQLITAFVIFVTFMGAVLLYWGFREFPYQKFSHILQTNKLDMIEGSVELEEGSSVNPEDLKVFKLLANSHSKLSVSKSNVLITDLIFKGVSKNQCDKQYCLQYLLPVENIPSHVWRSLIGIEDERFFEHKGVDFKAVARAIVKDIISLSMKQGASTITQQLVKNLFLSSEKKISRKVKEALYSFYIEYNYSKEEIVQLYLNIVYWGVVQGVEARGIKSASLLYFEKKPELLSVYESIILVSMLKGPEFYHPLRHLNRLKSRVSTLVERLDGGEFPQGMIKKWSDKKWQQWHEKLTEGDKERIFFPLLFQGPQVATKKIFSHYSFVRRAYAKLKNYRAESGRPIALKMITGTLEEKDNYFSFYSSLERNRDKAIKSEFHQVGSILKPIIYSLLVEMGLDMGEESSTQSLELDLLSGKWLPHEPSWRFRNKDGITFKTALQKSLNRPLIRASQKIGFDKLEEKLKLKIPRLTVPLREYPAQLLGAIELSLYDLFEIYKEFFRNSCQSNIRQIVEILSDTKKTTISRLLKNELEDIPFFGKTGTSNGSVDNWFIGFDGTELTIIWVGVEQERDKPLKKFSGPGRAFPIYQDYLLSNGRRMGELFSRCSAVN